MAAAVSGRDPGAPAQHYGTIVVIGGGCYGSYYVRQLRRARSAGAIRWNRVLVVDRDAQCRVAGDAALATRDADGTGDGIAFVCEDWHAFLDRWLGDAASVADAAAIREGTPQSVPDAIVPSPLMPHLLFDWVLARARRRWPDRAIVRVPLAAPPPVPWQRASPGGTHYVSFAEWMCPVNCIEPRRCPETRGVRHWSLPATLRSHLDERRAAGDAMVGPLVFHCTHRVYGIGMIDVHEVLAADRAVDAAGTPGPARVLIGTMSHCHGALDLVEIGAVGA